MKSEGPREPAQQGSSSSARWPARSSSWGVFQCPYAVKSIGLPHHSASFPSVRAAAAPFKIAASLLPRRAARAISKGRAMSITESPDVSTLEQPVSLIMTTGELITADANDDLVVALDVFRQG